MKLKRVAIKNFRRLENVDFQFEDSETIFVGPNNSGKTSATAAFRLFLVRPEFKIHDFCVSAINSLNAFGLTEIDDDSAAPSIDMDLWFSISDDVEFGRIFTLLTKLNPDLDKAGIRIKFCVKDRKKLKKEFILFCKSLGDLDDPRKILTHYLSLPNNLNRHFGLTYFALEMKAEVLVEHSIEPEEGKSALRALIRVDFVDAQRNIDDQEQRSNRLSSAFATFYKKNLEQADVNEEANRVIDENNDKLTKHYDKHFSDLMLVIRELGVPSANDRQLRLISSLSPEMALQGNTSLLYIDPISNHELPEAYNGLGFKNLIYMAIQVSHYHLQWVRTLKNRPLCQVIFIEEPEVHLHAQVQQTFISNIWKIVKKASEALGEINMVPQLAVTTHSSHILDAIEFEKVRYFRRCELAGEKRSEVKTLNASKVVSLREFRPQKVSSAGVTEDEKETLHFLRKYLFLTHCDLFFADAAVFVEGTVEKLLLPQMIKQSTPPLSRNYLTVLEVGGAYAHRFASLMDFLGMPYLVITDIDSVDPEENRKSCRADRANAVTSNAALSFFFNKQKISDLVSLNLKDKALFDGSCFVAFQSPTRVVGHTNTLHGRTLEEVFVYENIELFRANKIQLTSKLFPTDKAHESEYEYSFSQVSSKSFKKTEFALNVLNLDVAWSVPSYIAEGLVWLSERLEPTTPKAPDELVPA